MPLPPRIYLDHAATSWPKPECVYRAVDQYQRENGAPAGRSVYSHALAANQHLHWARARLARLLGASANDHIVFTKNGTEALNLALHGLLRQGDHVIATQAEHNSVLRPLRQLQLQRGVEVTLVPVSGQGWIDPADIQRQLRTGTRLIAVNHASNVTGTLQDLAAISQVAKAAGVFLLVDAAQSLGHVPFDLHKTPADLVAAPGHKGLLGPLGTGLLYLAAGMERLVAPLVQGGTGTQSELDLQPETPPERYESGNLNVPGLSGLAAATEYLLDQDLLARFQAEQALRAQLWQGLAAIDGVKLFGPSSGGGSGPGSASALSAVGVVSFRLQGADPQELALQLDSAFGIQVRSGLHCAPQMHAAIGTLDTGGTVRMSLGHSTTESEIEAAIAAVAACSL